jgi:hypothetical protein
MTWGGIIVTVLACTGLGIYLALAGLSRATDLASIISMFIAVAGLGVSVWGVIAARGSQPVGGQSVTGSQIGGHVTKVDTVGGSVRIGMPPPVGAPTSPFKAATPGPAAGEAAEGGQSVTDSEVAGTVSHIGSVGDDLDIGGGP